ncbi:hypothetical protein PT7_0300 [Pusillimonas sp. T7-7]|nr:hypothetical protein PT7_0300 [Pusillimonas sp. T7-7]
MGLRLPSNTHPIPSITHPIPSITHRIPSITHQNPSITHRPCLQALDSTTFFCHFFA